MYLVHSKVNFASTGLQQTRTQLSGLANPDCNPLTVFANGKNPSYPKASTVLLEPPVRFWSNGKRCDIRRPDSEIAKITAVVHTGDWLLAVVRGVARMHRSGAALNNTFIPVDRPITNAVM